MDRGGKYPRVFAAGLLASSLTLALSADGFSEAAAPPAPTLAPAAEFDPQAVDEGSFVLRSIHEASRSRRLAPPVTNATSVHTADWACIRRYESGDRYHIHSGAYGFLGPAWRLYGNADYAYPGAAPRAAQDAAALRLYHANGEKFSGSWNDYCTFHGIVR